MIKKLYSNLRLKFNIKYDYYLNSSDSKKSIQYLEEKIPDLNSISEKMDFFRDKIKKTHTKYIHEVSNEEMAISFEQSCFLSGFCQITNPSTVLDLGSGYSSLLFRKYANASVTSIDDSKDWLTKTKNYLDENQVSSNNVFSWDEFENKGLYDLVFHDMGNMETRINTFKDIANLVNKGGFLFLDDVHKVPYAKYVKDNLNLSKFDIYNIYNLTVDKYGRFMYLCIRK